MGLDQLYFSRPVPLHSSYRCPLRGLYLCGSGAHPGEWPSVPPLPCVASEGWLDIRGLQTGNRINNEGGERVGGSMEVPREQAVPHIQKPQRLGELSVVASARLATAHE